MLEFLDQCNDYLLQMYIEFLVCIYLLAWSIKNFIQIIKYTLSSLILGTYGQVEIYCTEKTSHPSHSERPD